MGNNAFQLMPHDTGANPDSARKAAQQEVAEGAQLILGPLFSADVRAVKPVAAGAGMLTIVWLARALQQGKPVRLEGYAVTFLVLGAILTITGTHMTLTWPFAKYFPFGNIIFGEPSLGFGVLLLGCAIFLWRRKTVPDTEDRAGELASVIAPLGIVIVAFVAAVAGMAGSSFSAAVRARRRERSEHGGSPP